MPADAMIKRVLFGLTVLACGMVPALADPHRGHGAPPPGAPVESRQFEARPFGGRQFEGRQFEGRQFEGRQPGDRPFAGRPDFESRGEVPPREEDRPRRRADQDRARAQMRAGAIRPLRDIQQQWRRGMPGYDFLGSDFDPGAGSYRLKFLRDGSVIWIDVDGRTGREIGRRGR